MTFANFVLNLRRRLQDRYESDGTLITSADTDGVRWTSSELVDICNTSITAFTRLMFMYKEHPMFSGVVDAYSVLVASASVQASGVLTFADPTKVYDVLSVRKSSSKSYAPISTNLYTLYASDTKAPRSGEYFFSLFFDETNLYKYIRVLPAESATVDYVYLYIKNDYTSSDITGGTSLYITNFDDLLLDLAEREARDREHNWERSKVLDTRIISSLGVRNG